MGSFCSNCGTPIDGAKFCPACGSKVEVEENTVDEHKEEEIVAEKTVQEDVDKVQPQNYQQGSYQQPNYQQSTCQQPTYQQPVAPTYPQNRPQVAPVPMSYVEKKPRSGSPYEPITTGGFLGILLLLNVPVVGFIFLIVWACGGCQKENKKNFSRAVLLLMLIGIIIGAIIALIGVFFTDMIVDALYYM